jgi:hypothetical protein
LVIPLYMLYLGAQLRRVALCLLSSLVWCSPFLYDPTSPS